MPKTANVFAVDIRKATDRHVHSAIVSVTAKSPTAALARGLELFTTEAREQGKTLDVDNYRVVSHNLGLYTVEVTVS